ncbi:LysR family transcriptional regulator [Streptomyces sp. CMB-StM0423]|uniref:LysR family transcriptional regulator n=1 Tax=Streptomyces sp. CMB-StM0423 TaxID=2059884 RepID=UPI000C7113A6|nr:LysR family transcriptional regulator [Streptomyces sp. CMB-StM0423]AUH41090.1 LysR family transcriptional regulator [Streptomyces sp. CMB-StM0423]
MFDARHLRVLRAVAATGSFSAAARELGLTQPAVSQQMKALEQTAATPLLVRAGRELRLTEAGEALARHAGGILAGLAAAEDEVAALAGLRAGRVRLVSFPSGSSTIVPGALAAMRAAHPGTRISLVDAEPPRSVEMLREGECEIALAFHYPPAGGTVPERGAAAAGAGAAGDRVDGWDGLVVRPLLADRLLCLVPEGHPAAAAGRLELAELAAEPVIAGCPRCRRHLVELCERAGFAPRIDFATDDYPAVVGLVRAGLGVAVLPGLAVRAVPPRGVVTVPLMPEARREVVALTLPDLARVPAVAAMLDRLAAAAKDAQDT